MEAVSGQYNATPPTLTTGTSGFTQMDASANIKETLATKLAGEDLTNDVMKVEGQFTYATITTGTTTTIKTGSGVVHSVSIVGGTLGAITAYDNTSGSGTTILPTFTPTATLPCPPIILDAKFSTGLTIVTAAATIITICYR